MSNFEKKVMKKLSFLSGDIDNIVDIGNKNWIAIGGKFKKVDKEIGRLGRDIKRLDGRINGVWWSLFLTQIWIYFGSVAVDEAKKKMSKRVSDLEYRLEKLEEKERKK